MYKAQRSLAFSSVIFLAVFLFAGASFVSIASAQGETELSGTIRAALLSDPRAESLSQEEFDELVSALSSEAQSEGITAEDIVWRPEAPGTGDFSSATTQNTCGNSPAFLCALNDALGFSSGNLLIPILLFAASVASLFVLREMRRKYLRDAIVPQENTPPRYGA